MLSQFGIRVVLSSRQNREKSPLEFKRHATQRCVIDHRTRAVYPTRDTNLRHGREKRLQNAINTYERRCSVRNVYILPRNVTIPGRNLTINLDFVLDFRPNLWYNGYVNLEMVWKPYNA